MCGIAGQLNFKGPGDDFLVKKMTRKMIHRGPDSEGYYSSNGLAFGMRRLSIIDLSTGDQPIHNEDKTVWTVFNGEIYNYKELKKDLQGKGHVFYTESDTEVLVHLYEEYEDNFIKKLNGMFGLAVWDEKENKLILGRDRSGEKSLYYYFDGRQLLFASELKSVLESSEIKRVINLEALHYYLVYGRVPSPYSIIENVKKLEPAEMLIAKNGGIVLKKYWTVSFKNKIDLSESEIKKELLVKLEKSVKVRMEADVPLGAFLSGGVDSSAVVAFMAKNSRKPIETFSVGFEEKDFSELSYAKIVADKFSTNHHEFIMRPDILDILPKLAYHMDEPFSDYSIIPTYFISNETRKFVTVALTGDGADELFAGYESYKAIKIAQTYNKLPDFLKELIYKITKNLPDNDEREKIIRYVHKLKRMAKTQRNTGSDALKILLSISSGFAENTLKNDLYNLKIRDKIIQYNALGWRQKFTEEYDGNSDIEAVLYSQFKTLLPDMFFTKVDRCSMAASLETRAPFADHECVEFAATIPFEYKLKGLKTKYILKESLRGLLPDEVLFRHKKGFSLPLHRWIKDEKFLNKIKESLLSVKMLGLFEEDYIKRLLESYKDGNNTDFDKIWRLYMLALWQEEYLQ